MRDSDYAALADVLGVIAVCDHAYVWKYGAFILHAVNTVNYSATDQTLAPPDCMFGVSSGPRKLWRTQRYFVLRDMLAPFVSRTGVKQLVRVTASGPDSPGGTADNAVHAIQAAAGISDDGRTLEILAANIDAVSAHTVRFAFGQAASGPVTGARLGNDLVMDTPLPRVEGIDYEDGSQTSFVDTVGPASAALYVVPLANAAVDGGVGDGGMGTSGGDGGDAASGNRDGGSGPTGLSMAGCGCSVPGRPARDPSSAGLVLVLLALVSLGARRRR